MLTRGTDIKRLHCINNGAARSVYVSADDIVGDDVITGAVSSLITSFKREKLV
jgi:hypothetical protein